MDTTQYQGRLYQSHELIEKEYKPRFNKYVKEIIDKEKPDYLALVDRKGRLFDEMDIIPEPFRNLTFYKSAFELMTPNEIENKKIVVFDDVVQHGTTLRRYRNFFKEMNADVTTCALIRRNSYYKRGMIKDPLVKAFLDLEDTSFMRVANEFNNYFILRGKPLDIDHIGIKMNIKSRFNDIEELLFFLAKLGNITLIPSGAEQNGILTITIDQPNFFDFNKFLLSKYIFQDGVCKIRLYIDLKNDVWYCVPIIFPFILIKNDNINKLKSELLNKNDYFKEVYNYIKNFDNTEIEYKSKILFQCVTLWLTTRLLVKFLMEIRKYIEISKNDIELEKKELIMNNGEVLGNTLLKKVEKDISIVFNTNNISNPQRDIFSFTSSKAYDFSIPTDMPIDIENTCEQIIELLASKRKIWEKELLRKGEIDTIIDKGLSFKEIKNELTHLNEREIGRGLDILLDQSVIKPMNEVREIIKGQKYHCIRSYRVGEFEELGMRDIERIVRMVPLVFSEFIKNTPRLGDGIPSKLAYKIIVNFRHDWNVERFGELYLDWRPYKFGAIPCFPERYDPYSEVTNLWGFAKKYGTYQYENERFKPNPGWDTDIETYIDPEEIIIIQNLTEIYSHIYSKLDDERTDLLTTLSSCRDKGITYVHCYENFERWKTSFRKFLVKFGFQVSNLRVGNICSDLESNLGQIATEHYHLNDKLERYKRLGKLKQSITDAFRNHRQRHLVRRILDDLETPPELSDKPPFPLLKMQNAFNIMKGFTSLVRCALSDTGVVSDDRSKNQKIDEKTGNIKDLNWYKNNLIEKIPMIENDLIIFLENVNKRDFKRIRGQIDILLDKIINMLNGDLPKPKVFGKRIKELEDFSEHLYRHYLEAAIELTQKSVKDECIMIFIDLWGFDPVPKEIAALLEIENIDDVREKVRNFARNPIKNCLQNYDSKIVSFQEVGSDGWLILTKNIEDGIAMAVDIQKDMEKTKIPDIKQDIILPKIGINCGIPRLALGGPYDEEFITIYRILEEKGIAYPGDIIITKKAHDLLKNPKIRKICRSLGPQSIKYRGDIEIFRVDWSILNSVKEST